MAHSISGVELRLHQLHLICLSHNKGSPAIQKWESGFENCAIVERDYDALRRSIDAPKIKNEDQDQKAISAYGSK